MALVLIIPKLPHSRKKLTSPELSMPNNHCPAVQVSYLDSMRAVEPGRLEGLTHALSVIGVFPAKSNLSPKFTASPVPSKLPPYPNLPGTAVPAFPAPVPLFSFPLESIAVQSGPVEPTPSSIFQYPTSPLESVSSR